VIVRWSVALESTTILMRCKSSSFFARFVVLRNIELFFHVLMVIGPLMLLIDILLIDFAGNSR
jgi:hypothetical protein